MRSTKSDLSLLPGPRTHITSPSTESESDLKPHNATTLGVSALYIGEFGTDLDFM